MPIIEQWQEPWFVTLTSKAVPKKWLIGRMESTLRAFCRINDKYRKRNQRGDPFRLLGIKSLECNFNPKARTYNVHLHIIVPDQETAEVLRKEWIALWTNNDDPKYRYLVSPKAQYAKKVKNGNTAALIEIIKYGSKIFTEVDVLNKSKSLDEKKLYVRALFNILEGMKDLRIFDRFGFDLPKQTERKKPKIQISSDYEIWLYLSQYQDWINVNTGLSVSTYTITPELNDLLKNRVDIESE